MKTMNLPEIIFYKNFETKQMFLNSNIKNLIAHLKRKKHKIVREMLFS